MLPENIRDVPIFFGIGIDRSEKMVSIADTDTSTVKKNKIKNKVEFL